MITCRSAAYAFNEIRCASLGDRQQMTYPFPRLGERQHIVDRTLRVRKGQRHTECACYFGKLSPADRLPPFLVPEGRLKVAQHFSAGPGHHVLALESRRDD